MSKVLESDLLLELKKRLSIEGVPKYGPTPAEVMCENIIFALERLEKRIEKLETFSEGEPK